MKEVEALVSLLLASFQVLLLFNYLAISVFFFFFCENVCLLQECIQYNCTCIANINLAPMNAPTLCNDTMSKPLWVQGF